MAQARILLDRLETVDGGHLMMRIDRPAVPRDAKLCVLYMHGFGSRQTGTKAEFFRRCFQRYGIDFCSFDFQGHGDSGGGMRGLTLSRNLEDVDRVHEALRGRGYERVLLFGSSMGAATGLWYAARNPQDVAAAVHVAPALEMERRLLAWAGPEGAERWQREGTIELESEPLAIEIFDRDPEATGLGWGLIEDLRSYDLEELQATYHTPTLLLQGMRDESVSWHKVIELAAGCAFDGLEVHLMADGDHRLVDRLPHLWALTRAFLEARGVAEADGDD